MEDENAYGVLIVHRALAGTVEYVQQGKRRLNKR